MRVRTLATLGSLRAKALRQARDPIEFVFHDLNLTWATSLVIVDELDRVLGIRFGVDPTEVETYGGDKRGFAWNYECQWARRPCPAV